MSDNYEELYEKLGYRFRDEKLLHLSLTHRSKGGKHNERLEFLGDSIISCVVAEALYHQFAQATEGELSRWRAVLVNRDTLGHMARDLDLGKFLYLGPGELKSGGGERHSILSCAIEAVVGGIYLDAGFEETREVLMKWYESALASLSTAASHKDPKTVLQEYLQSRHFALPIYEIEVVEGAAHKQIFTVTCSISGLEEKSRGQGMSRRRAEQAAAEAMLVILRK